MRKQLALAVLAAALTAMSATPLYADDAETNNTPPASEVSEDENEGDDQENPPDTIEGLPLGSIDTGGVVLNHNLTLVVDC